MKEEQSVQGAFEAALSAIADGTDEEAMDHVKALNEAALQVHDRMVQYVNLLLAFIAQEMGEEKIQDAWRYIIERIHKKGVVALKGKSHREVVKVFQGEHLAHGSTLSLSEGKDRSTFLIHSCGSGGRLRRDGLEGEEGKFKKPYSWCFGRKGISYYCSHCAIVTEDSPHWDADFTIEVEYGRQFDQEGKPVEEPCLFKIVRKQKDREGA